MFEQNHSLAFSHNTVSQETNQERFIRIKKSKNIRKDKVMERRIKNCEIDLLKDPTTKDTKKDLQKQKNRVAAQLSRDRQKKYVQDLSNRIADLEKQLLSKLCYQCRATISENSTSEQQNMEGQCQNLMDLPKSSELGLLNYQQQIPEFDQFPLIRDNSTKDAEWGNTGKYFCLFMMLFAVALLSNSVESTANPSSKQMTRILTQRQLCSEQFQQTETKVPVMNKNSSEINFSNQVSLTLEQFHTSSWPFKKNTGSRTEECKNNFWNSYLQNLLNEQNPYDWNLVSCTNPNLIHISTVYQQTMNSLGGKWTFLITNPTVSHSHVQKGGNHLIDEVNYLEGVYQLVAEGVVLKKVMGQNCLV